MSVSSPANPTNDVKLGFDQIFETYYDSVYRYCLRRLGPSEAEDGAADVFAVVWRRIDDVPSTEGTRAWLFAVAYRVVGNRYRGRRRQRSLRTRLEASKNPPTVTSESEDEVGAVLEALDKLTATDRELLRLSAWDDLDRHEISHVLGIKENAVDQRLFRARSRFKTQYDRLNIAPADVGTEEAQT